MARNTVGSRWQPLRGRRPIILNTLFDNQFEFQSQITGSWVCLMKLMDTGCKLVSPIFAVQINCWVHVLVTFNILPVAVTVQIPALVINSHLDIAIQTFCLLWWHLRRCEGQGWRWGELPYTWWNWWRLCLRGGGGLTPEQLQALHSGLSSLS